MSGKFDLSEGQLYIGATAFEEVCRSNDLEKTVAGLSNERLFYLAGYLRESIGHKKGIPGLVAAVVEIQASNKFCQQQAYLNPNDQTAAEAFDSAMEGTASEMRGKDAND